jgi:S-adenosylmethionine/arginine decarboxylase-like enzyme
MSFVLSLGVFEGDSSRVEEALCALGMPDGRDTVHQFEPVGVSWVRWAETGRAAIHTWPEQGLVSVDVLSDQSLNLAARLASIGWISVEESSR